MPISLDGLDPAFKAKLQTTLTHCAALGVEMIPYFGMRTTFEQGALYRQSRSSAEIATKLAELISKGAPFLAHCISSVGPQHGPPVTNAIPGLSWHQWGEAMDCYWLKNGKAEWDTEVGGIKNGYRIYADTASQEGIFAGGHWQSFKDWPHIQLHKAGSPLGAGKSLIQIDAAMKAKFG
jgi:peptidoglycan LD-endopeptidase CwlK